MKPKITLRQVDLKKDIQILCEFHKDHVRINFPDSNYVEHLFLDILKKHYKKEPEGMFIVEAYGMKKPIGFLWLHTIFDPYKDIKYGDLHYIHLSKDSRGMGIGTMLMKKTEDYFKKKDCKEIRLGTDARNTPSIGLYEKFGFRIKRVLMEKQI